MNPITALAKLVRFLHHGPARPPQGVRALVDDQWIEPIELVYVGKNERGNDEWIARFDVLGDDVNDFHIDLLPGRTSLAFAFLTDPGDTP